MLPITCHWQSRFREIRWWGNFKRSSCRSDTLVFLGSQTCGILLFRTRAESSFGEQKVKDSDRLELDWLLKCKLEELIASVRPMSAKNCEQIVRAILDRIGGPSFEQLTGVVRRPTQTSITLQSVICFLMCPRKMMSWADSYVSLCECACCGLKRIPIQPRIEQNIFMLFAAAERDDTHSKKPSPLQFAARIQM